LKFFPPEKISAEFCSLAVFPLAKRGRGRGVEGDNGWDFPILQNLATIEAYREWKALWEE
jgi:hypothetical protein